MWKEQRLRRSAEFALVQQKGRWWSNPLLVLRALPNGREVTRFGFVVGKRVGPAVTRNRVRRRLREIARGEAVPGGWDLVFVARGRAGEASYAEMLQAARDVLRRGRLHQRPPEAARSQGSGR